MHAENRGCRSGPRGHERRVIIILQYEYVQYFANRSDFVDTGNIHNPTYNSMFSTYKYASRKQKSFFRAQTMV
jgi:hypothetical protein